MLIEERRVAARKQGWAAKLRFCDAIIEQHRVGANPIAGFHPRSVKPILIAAQEHVNAGNVALHPGHRAQPYSAADQKRLRRDQLTERALGGELFVVVKPIGILHPLHPAPDIAPRDRFL
jgi:hypothetical protein